MAMQENVEVQEQDSVELQVDPQDEDIDQDRQLYVQNELKSGKEIDNEMQKTGFCDNQRMIRDPQEAYDDTNPFEEEKKEEENKEDINAAQVQSANWSAGAPIIASFSIV